MTAGIIDLNEFLEDIRLSLPWYTEPGVDDVDPDAPISPSLLKQTSPPAPGTRAPFIHQGTCKRMTTQPEKHSSAACVADRIVTRACSTCRAKRFGLSASGARPATEILSGQPPCRRQSQDIGRDDQGALGLRAGSPAAQGRTRPRPLRRPLMARSSPPRADDHNRLRLPPSSSPRRRERGEKKSRPARLNRPCRPYEKPSSWPRHAPRPTCPHCRRQLRRPLT